MSDEKRRQEYDRKIRSENQSEGGWNELTYQLQLWMGHVLSLSSFGQLVALLGIATIACEYLWMPIWRYLTTPPRIRIGAQQKAAEMQVARLRLQERYDEEKAASKIMKRRRI